MFGCYDIFLYFVLKLLDEFDQATWFIGVQENIALPKQIQL